MCVGMCKSEGSAFPIHSVGSRYPIQVARLVLVLQPDWKIYLLSDMCACVSVCAHVHTR